MMTVNDFSEKMKAVKAKETKVIFRDREGNSYESVGMFYGLNEGNAIRNPQIGEEPNCVVIQIDKA